MGWLARRFKFQERNTDFWQEVRGGTSTFLTMAYILLVNPQVLGKPHTGLERSDVVIGTAISSAVGSLIVGIFANLPFGLAPGLGLSAYLSYGLVKGRGVPWDGALSSAFVAGFIMTLLALINLSDTAMKWIPTTIKIATVIGMGLLLTFIGMQSIELVVAAGDDSLVKLGPLDRLEVWLSLGGLLLLATLAHHGIKGGVVIGIFAVTIIIWGVRGEWPDSVIELPKQSNGIAEKATQFELIFDNLHEYLSGIGAFLLVGVFDVSGVMFGLAVLAGLQSEDREGNSIVPNSKWVFLAAGIGTMVAACLGCSPIIVHIESAAGIKEGGRTGLCAIVVAFWFTLALFFAPLLGSIPQEATAPVVILIGASMMGQASEIDWKEMRVAVPAFLTLSIMPFTFSIPNGIAFGLASNIILHFTCKTLCGGTKPIYLDEFSHHSPKSGPIMLDQSKNLSYGTLSGATSNQNHHHEGGVSPYIMHRTMSQDSFVRSPTLILRREEYTVPHHYE